MKSKYGSVVYALVVMITSMIYGCKSTSNDDTFTKENILEFVKYRDSIVNGCDEELWGISLYSPIIIVDQVTREFYSFVLDDGGYLIEKGLFPDTLNIANSSIHWQDNDWTMIQFQSLMNHPNKCVLLIHESFHAMQQKLGFHSSMPDNKHLEGYLPRLSMILEAHAILEAYLSENSEEKAFHIENALIFRRFRHLNQPDRVDDENSLEMNEGFAEYTGIKMCLDNKAEISSFLEKKVTKLQFNPSLALSFAYTTTPVYCLILDDALIQWRNKRALFDLGDLLSEAYSIEIIDSTVEQRFNELISKGLYKAFEIKEFEANRKQIMDSINNKLENIFLERDVIALPLENMNIRYNPNSVFAFKDYGIYYSSLRIVDNWGILESDAGALILSDHSFLLIPGDKDLDSLFSSGKLDLKLNDGWKMEKAKKGFIIMKE